MEAELQQYYSGIRGDLKVQNAGQLKYVTEEDLAGIGMTKPEMRRLKKYFQKHFPQNYLSKFKKMLLPKKEEQIGSTLNMLQEERHDRPTVRVPNKHMIPADAIIVNKELGTGEFGVVQQGVWTNDGERIQVAIKCLSRERMQNNPIEFLKEAAIMHSIDHEHIVRLYGVVLDTNSLMLVTELAPLRSLLECLKEPQLRSSFPVPSLCDFCVQIADGMQYLEAKRLIHRDLAARNILVFSKNKVKISDFGLSRALGVGKDYYQTNFNVNLKLPIAWCAPESISFLKFTSASDVWAYGVTLWEMFSYGFQPWAALTGHQILEAIDEPNFQRLEQPDCCPKDYFALMLQCWQHEPTKRPKFSELISVLPDLKPEQVQAVQENSEIGQLAYRQGDVITVLDKGTSNTLWKGVLINGKTGFFNPAHTIAYLGNNLPSNKPGEFTRGDGKNIFSSQRRKIRTDMISSPQGDLKHTGHVGLDGAYFGDISFLGGKYPHLPRQVVAPYKPQEDATDNNSSQNMNHDVTVRDNVRDNRRETQSKHESMWSDTCSEISQLGPNNASNNIPDPMVSSTDSSTICGDHEYHEISDEENQNSPMRFDKPLSFDFGPSLLDEMDEMFRSLGSSPPPPTQGHSAPTEHESSNARNELREIQAKQNCKKKQATVSPINVKPISAADQKTLYSAIAMAQELTARSMTDLEHPQEPHSPRTPASPSRRRKFSFKLPHQHSPKPDRRHFAEEAASIPDIQASLSDEAKEVYNSLVDTPIGAADPSSDITNPLRMLRSGLPVVRPRLRGNKHAASSLALDEHLHTGGSMHLHQHSSGARTLPKQRVAAPSCAPPPVPLITSNPLHQTMRPRLHRSSMEIENCNPNHQNVIGGRCLAVIGSGICSTEDNPIPLPPRDRSKTLQPKSSLPRHQRKHPLIIPGGGLSRTLAKVQQGAVVEMKDQVDGVTEVDSSKSTKQNLMDGINNSDFAKSRVTSEPSCEFIAPGNNTQVNSNSTDDFERRIDSELAALDSLPIEDICSSSRQRLQQKQQHRCSIISEDLLEFSENLIDCDAVDSSDDICPLVDNRKSPTLHGQLNILSNELPLQSSTSQCLESAKEKLETMTRTSDHVSCEDLLEFACDGPNSRRTRGPNNGERSDEVRIMLKVLHEQSTPESCVAALNVTNWDVLAAIKLERLQGLLKKENNFVGLEDCKIMLNQCGGDVVKAATLLRNTEDTAAV
ncbi:hypothetical protein QAD02_000551 [Eretmocerus hayati]|uniref:Uncharacterized protein n=1 Tax=Eretmocerus hayati TaxID=131215 RepID=A0ACC2NDX1_9HYME|nr:hypothetical protein QAD02_000551 [Eretmocerus hayati]